MKNSGDGERAVENVDHNHRLDNRLDDGFGDGNNCLAYDDANNCTLFGTPPSGGTEVNSSGGTAVGPY